MPPTPNPTIGIVAVGASAGGVEALRVMFHAIAPESVLCFIVLLHLDPDGVSSLTEIIARVCPLRVSTAVNGDTLDAGRVLVVPPGVAATVADGRLVLTPFAGGQRHPRTIDTLFSALALDQKERAIAVVLSGMGDDGTLGCKAIREQGGLTIAQAVPAETDGHQEMPENAIASGFVDCVLAVADIPARLAHYVDGFEKLAGLTAEAAEDAATGENPAHEGHAAISAILRRVVGHDFSRYKERSFMRRVQRRMQILQITALDLYIDRLEQDHDEVQALFRDCLIGVTAFFRDPATFAALEARVIPALFEGKGVRDTVRVWVPGCATGEEAYSIAILLAEHAARLKIAPRLMVFATDIDEGALRAARAGRFTAAELDGVSPERLARFFIPDGGIHTVVKELRDMCVFSAHSLIRDPPFSRLDLVSCRNLLIYLDTAVQRELFPLFHFALRAGGFLLLGAAESAEPFSGLFSPIDKHHRLYRRRDQDASPLQLPLRHAVVNRHATGIDSRPRATSPDARQMAEALVLNRYAPPHVVVTRDGEIVHFSARTGRYLEAPAGQPTRNLISLARYGFRLELRAALEQAARTSQIASRVGLELDESGRSERVQISVEPLPADAGPAPMFLVLFSPLETPAPAAALPSADGTETPLLLAEREMDGLREQLQTLIEDHETTVAELSAANEELMSVNEEFQSTNEELETSKEEQQSINEELQTVNHELQAKLDELDRTNLELRNLFEATDIATVTLDRSLRIKGFSPAMTRLLNLLQGDIGRPLSDITGSIDTAGLLRDALAVLDGGPMIERHLKPRDTKAHFMCRAFPYRGTEGALEGVLLSFVDITQLVEALEAARSGRRQAERSEAARAELDRILSSAPVVVYCGFLSPAGGFAYEYLSRGIERLTGWPWDRFTGPDGITEIVAPEKRAHDADDLRKLLAQGEFRDTFRLRRADGSWIWVRSTQVVLNHDPVKGAEVAGFIADITEERLSDARTIASARLASLGEMAAGLAHELKQPLQSILLLAEMNAIVAERAGLLAVREPLGRIADQATRAADIIEPLRNFATGGDDVAPSRPLALDQIIASALMLVQGALHEAEVVVEQDLDEPPLMVMGSALELEQVLTNLLLNARDALTGLPAGRTRTIRVTARRDVAAGVVLLTVADNGGGVAADMLTRLFEPFQTTKGPDRGTGLGLSICRGLLRARGAAISHQNDPDGAVFTVTLPEAAVPPADQPAGVA